MFIDKDSTYWQSGRPTKGQCFSSTVFNDMVDTHD